MPQLPFRQMGVPLAAMQALAQLEQCKASFFRSASHPSAAIMLQSSKPGLHASTAHAPILHTDNALASAQRLAHAPQFIPSVARSDSHPLAPLPSQSPKPATQAVVQAPLAHANDWWSPAVHALSHDPQFFASVVPSTSQPVLA